MKYNIYLLLSLILISSCSVKDDIPDYANLIEPQDNQLVLSEATFGHTSNYSGFYLSEKSNTGNFYIVGDMNGSLTSTEINVGESDFEDYYEPSLIKFDVNGNKLWEKHPGFIIQRLLIVPNNTLSDKEYIVLTGYDNNEVDFQDESPDRSRIMLYDEDGNFIDNHSSDFVLNLLDLKILENNTNYVKFLGVGSIFKLFDNSMYPGFFEFKIFKNSLSINGNSVQTTELVNDDWKHVMFMNIELINNQLVVSGTQYENNTFVRAHVFKFSKQVLTTPIWWNSIVTEKPIYHWRGGLAADNDMVYLCGYFEDVDKGMANENEYWNTGYLATFDLDNGVSLWDKSFSYSELSDRIHSLDIDGGDIFISGIISFVWYSNMDVDYTIGNGIIVRLNKQNGEFLSERTFGNVINKTLFRTSLIHNNTFWAIGQRQLRNSQSQGLLIELNKSAI